MQDNRVVNAFAELRSAGEKTLLPFITAGYPDLETTRALLEDVERRGVRICELGIPFSDPIADGPTIQASYTATLETGVTVKDIFEMVREYRASASRERAGTSTDDLALLAMVSYSIVFRCGAEAFCTEAAEAGFDGLIVPDLPVDEAGAFYRKALQMWEKTVGHEHPHTAVALNNLGLLHCRRKQYDPAERFFERALIIREKTLGPAHPEVLAVLQNMVRCYRKSGNARQAKKSQQRIDRIKVKKTPMSPEEQ